MARPEIADADYDSLIVELIGLEDAYPQWRYAHSPTQNVDIPPDTTFAPVRHTKPMLSLHNALSIGELRDWQSKVLRRLGSRARSAEASAYAAELKFDGMAISLRYEEGVLARGTTRGDGRVGEDVTPNVRTISDIPDRLGPGAPAVLEARGEVYMRVSAFEALNQAQQARGAKAYVNPRNAAVGSLRQKDASVTAGRGLSLWCYQLVAAETADGRPVPGIASHTGALEWLAALGLPVNEHSARLEGLAAVERYIDEFARLRHSLDYQFDGMVVKLDDLAVQDALGADAKAPRWAIAYKLPPEERSTLLEGIEVSIGPSGQATPFARLEPVFVGGVTVSTATLHNEDQVAAKDVAPGRHGDRAPGRGCDPRGGGACALGPAGGLRAVGLPRGMPAVRSGSAARR